MYRRRPVGDAAGTDREVSTSDVDDDRPVAGTEVQLTPITRGVPLTGSVESLDGETLADATLVVRPSAPGRRTPTGDAVHGTIRLEGRRAG